MSGNPLVATAEAPSGATTNMGSSDNEWNNLNAQTSGSGIFNDVAATITDARAGDWVNLGLDAVTDGLDLLGVAMDPLGALASAGVGWLIEHISFLKDGLDKLAGNPEAVTAKATTWENIAKQLEKSAGEYEQAAAKVRPDFQGQGGSAYQNTAAGYVATLKGASGQAKGTSAGMQVAAALVGTERGIIRDMISSFVGELIVKGLAALAASWCTFGGTIAAFIADTVVEGGILAEKISSRIAKVVEQLDKLAQKAGKAKSAIEDASNALKKIGKGADKLTDKSVDVAARAEQKGLDAKSAARDAGKSHVDESVPDKAERWHDAWKDKIPGQEKLEDHVKPYTEDGRHALSPNSWNDPAQAGKPAWNRADTIGVVTEGRRQENEQIDRARESAESYEKERAKEERGGEGEPK
ncbi:PPE domain-containing protein [Amycolatopsis orientalis]|uniref:PPE domain-containing protein n=1 Tax=Amycolatopsis orientalis TaxID=31958 RepID=UPI0003A39FAA|nr:PPE domain-containing protein [Amycolatopsis orientalis]